jgi:hypothetical protein
MAICFSDDTVESQGRALHKDRATIQGLPLPHLSLGHFGRDPDQDFILRPNSSSMRLLNSS